MKQKVIFLDRDGTLIEEVNFLSTVEETKLFPFTIEALRILKEAGFLFAVTTNQSGVARGYFDTDAVDAIHSRINGLLEPAGLEINSFQYCPHFPDEGCECRKPGIGMINETAALINVDLEKSWVIGDKKLDIGMGFNAGTRTALVLTGYGAEHRTILDRQPDIVASDLLDAAKQIVARERTLN